MNRPCQYTVDCPGTDLPYLNLSSEVPDFLDYLGFGFAYGPGGGIPPMQQDWTLTACGVTLFHSDSPISAQLQAIADSIQCDAQQRYPDQPLNGNNSEICCQPSPNGETCYTIDHGVIGGRTQAEADQRAAALACYFARRTQGRTFRLNTLSGGCLNAPYVQDIIPSGGVPPYIIEITGGTLPPGVGFFQADPRFATLSGQPSQAGNFTFTVQVSDIAGNVLLRQDVTVAVLAITNPTLPQGTVGTAYSEQLIASGGAGSYTFTTGTGFLPGGLSMDTAGSITGTPVVAADTFFTVTMTDSAGHTCQQQCEINVVDACTPDTGPAVPVLWPPGQPTRVRIVNYTNILSAFGSCAACDASIAPAWDGTLPQRITTGPGNLAWFPSTYVDPPGRNGPLSIAGRNVGDGAQFGSGPELQFISGASWNLFIFCRTGASNFYLWKGVKNVGLTPDGTYMRAPDSQASVGPPCIHIEIY